VVHLDLRHLGAALINRKLPFVRELCLKYQNIDPVTQLIPVRPVVHYMMGGVHTDIDGATPLAGLYAAGEVACVSINGANRLGSNSLPELLVFGARAGRAAAEYAVTAPEPGRHAAAQLKDEQRRLETERVQPGGRERIADLRQEMQAAMEASAGIYRTGPSLARGVDAVRGLQARARDLRDAVRDARTRIDAAAETTGPPVDITTTRYELGAARADLVRRAAEGKLVLPVAEVFPLERAAEAAEASNSRGRQGKIALRGGAA